MRCTTDDAVATVTIANPPVSAMSDDVLRDLSDVFCELDVNPVVRAVVITGAVAKAFAAGAELQQVRGMLADGEAGRRHVGFARRAFDALAELGRRPSPPCGRRWGAADSSWPWPLTSWSPTSVLDWASLRCRWG